MENNKVNLAAALKLKLPQILQVEKALDLLIEIVQEYIDSDNLDLDSTIVESFTGKGSFDEFSINIHELLGIYWVTAPEFDDEGYFTNINDARTFANRQYEPFITNYLNEKSNS